ncbi:methyl-accepting chemotaxis protein [Sporolactobacillus sp. THM7-4]|nr:methyl-accepting chemotaxis protein [Sporolactobacillus sp. THM7-4]
MENQKGWIRVPGKKREANRSGKKRKSWTMRTQILVSFLVLIILAGGANAVFGYFSVRNLIASEETKTMVHQVDAEDQNFSTFFKSKENILQQMALEPGIADSFNDKSHFTGFFKRVASSDQDLLNTYVSVPGRKSLIIYPESKLPPNFDARTRVWYKNAVAENGRPVWTTPYKDAVTGKMVVTAAKAIYRKGKLAAVVAVDVSLGNLSRQVEKMDTGKGGYVALVDQKRNYVASTRASLPGKKLTDPELIKGLSGKNSHGLINVKSGRKTNAVAYRVNEKTGWTMLYVIDRAQFSALTHSDALSTIILLIVILVLASLIAFFVSNSFSKRIQRLQEAVSRLEKGDLTVELAADPRDDELGSLSSGLKHMIVMNRDMLKRISGVSERVGDSSQTLVASVEENTASANEVSSTMSEIAAGASEQAELMNQNKKAADFLETKVEEIRKQTGMIEEGAEELTEASRSNRESVVRLRSHSELVISATAEIIDAITSLDGRSKNIGAIVETISDIAGQTNLLALNAAIEAARAGEQGKGFAVVADEVGKLAEQTDQALKQVSELVAGIQKDTNSTVAFAGNTSKVLEEQFVVVGNLEKAMKRINQSVEKNNDGIAKITASIADMAQQNKKIKEHISGMTEISEQTAAGTEEVTASIEEKTAAMEQLTKLAADLENDAAALQRDLKQFKLA